MGYNLIVEHLIDIIDIKPLIFMVYSMSALFTNNVKGTDVDIMYLGELFI